MTDPRVTRLAQLIVEYSLALQPRQILRIDGPERLLAQWPGGKKVGDIYLCFLPKCGWASDESACQRQSHENAAVDAHHVISFRGLCFPGCFTGHLGPERIERELNSLSGVNRARRAGGKP